MASERGPISEKSSSRHLVSPEKLNTILRFGGPPDYRANQGIFRSSPDDQSLGLFPSGCGLQSSIIQDYMATSATPAKKWFRGTCTKFNTGKYHLQSSLRTPSQHQPVMVRQGTK